MYRVCRMLRKNDVMAQTIDAGIRLSGFKHALPYTISVAWVGYLTSLSLNFFCKMGITILPTL